MTKPAATAVEPMCCGEPMVHNSSTGEYECASAYFALVDDNAWIDGVILALVEDDEVVKDSLDDLRHWRESRSRCEHVGCWPNGTVPR